MALQFVLNSMARLAAVLVLALLLTAGVSRPGAAQAVGVQTFLADPGAVLQQNPWAGQRSSRRSAILRSPIPPPCSRSSTSWQRHPRIKKTQLLLDWLRRPRSSSRTIRNTRRKFSWRLQTRRIRTSCWPMLRLRATRRLALQAVAAERAVRERAAARRMAWVGRRRAREPLKPSMGAAPRRERSVTPPPFLAAVPRRRERRPQARRM